MHLLDATIHCSGPDGERHIDINGFVEDLYQTALKPGEIITAVEFELPAAGSGGAYCSFKRCPPVYPTATVGVHMTLTDADVVDSVRVAMGSVGLTPLRSQAAEAELQGHSLTGERIENAAAAAVATSEPVDDQRGSAEFKKRVIGMLFRRAVGIAHRRCRGETVVNQPEYY
jgi:carbon-monoxide dehydrogenase medium subunit